jgi:predicted amidophosphoribosyltransferase
MTFPPQIDVVDQMQVTGAGLKGHTVMLDKAVSRARKLGRNVAETLSKPIEEMKWLGDDSGTCPVCHSNVLIVGKRNPIMCPICGSKGTIKIDGDNISVTFTKKEQERSRLTIAGKHEHWDELMNNMKSAKNADLDEIAKRLKKYQGYAEVKPKTHSK